MAPISHRISPRVRGGRSSTGLPRSVGLFGAAAIATWKLAIRWPRHQANIVGMTEGYQLLVLARGAEAVSMVPIARALGDYCVNNGLLVRAGGARCGAARSATAHGFGARTQD